MSDDLSKPEPPPIPNGHAPLWPQVIANTRSRSWPAEVLEAVIADMEARDASGRIKYKTPLQPFNGRSFLVDAYQENLDLVVYLKGALVEKYDAMVWACYEDALNMVGLLRGIIRQREGR